MSPGIASVDIEIHGQRLTFGGGVFTPQQFQWPVPGPRESKLTVTLKDGRKNIQAGSGAWSFFRLLDRATTLPGQSNHETRVNFGFEGHAVEVTFRVDGEAAFFGPSALRAFRCPSQL